MSPIAEKQAARPISPRPKGKAAQCKQAPSRKSRGSPVAGKPSPQNRSPRKEPHGEVLEPPASRHGDEREKPLETRSVTPRPQRQREKPSQWQITPDLSTMSIEELREVVDLEVSSPGIGGILFHGITDCSKLDVHRLVHLDIGEVLVYPYGNKPEPGKELNKRATVTMYQCWPPNGRGHLEDESAQERYRGKIKQMTEDKKATFIDYDCITGTWKFQVEHF